MDNRLRYGLQWHSGLGGVGDRWIGIATSYNGAINGGSGVALNIGDPVRLVSDGTVEHAEGSEASGGTADSIYGVVMAVSMYWDGTQMVQGTTIPNTNVWGTVYDRQPKVLVRPVLNQVWEVCCDAGGQPTTLATWETVKGNNADHVLVTGGEPKTQLLLDISSAGTATAQWRILDISPSVENMDLSGAYVRVLVTCNESQNLPGAFSATGI